MFLFWFWWIFFGQVPFSIQLISFFYIIIESRHGMMCKIRTHLRREEAGAQRPALWTAAPGGGLCRPRFWGRQSPDYFFQGKSYGLVKYYYLVVATQRYFSFSSNIVVLGWWNIIYYTIGGGNSKIFFIFTSRTLGKWFPISRTYFFKWVGSTTN